MLAFWMIDSLKQTFLQMTWLLDFTSQRAPDCNSYYNGTIKIITATVLVCEQPDYLWGMDITQLQEAWMYPQAEEPLISTALMIECNQVFMFFMVKVCI